MDCNYASTHYYQGGLAMLQLKHDFLHHTHNSVCDYLCVPYFLFQIFFYYYKEILVAQGTGHIYFT